MDVCKYEADVIGMKKDLYNDGHGIKHKVNTLWEQYHKNMGKRDLLLIINSVILAINGIILIAKTAGYI
jgi:hypothetical protein